MIKEKLQSQRGASMLMAMVFLLFCLFIGGSVLAAATANSSRIAYLMGDQQEYLSQRSALGVLAEMLTPQEGETLRITFRDDGTKTTVDIPTTNFRQDRMPAIQQLLYDIVIDHDYGVSDNLSYTLPNWTPTFGRSNQGGLQISFEDKILDATYDVTFQPENSPEKTCLLEITFTADSQVKLVMVGNINETAGSTTIGWSLPTIQKGGG